MGCGNSAPVSPEHQSFRAMYGIGPTLETVQTDSSAARLPAASCPHQKRALCALSIGGTV